MSRGAQAEKRSAAWADRLLLAPYSVWALIFILVPLAFVAYYAFTDNSFSFTLDNVRRFFTATSQVEGQEVHTYLLIFWRSLKLAIISTALCLVFGYPMAYFIARAKPRAQKTMITLIMIPMWMNFLIRTYAWMTILQDTESAVVVGMVYDYFPYMIMPIYSVMAKMDIRLVEAARDLGCNGFETLRRVIFPLSLPGVLSGVTMVLIPSISTFYISQKLGSGKFFLIGDAIEGQYIAGNLHFAAAIAFIMMVALLAAMALMKYLTGRNVKGGV